MIMWIGKGIMVLGVLVAVGWSGAALASAAHDQHGKAPAVRADAGAVQAPAGKADAAPAAEVAGGGMKCKQKMKAAAATAPAKPEEKTATGEPTAGPVQG